MNQEYYQLIETIFHSALELPEQDRPAYLDEVCSGNPELRDEINSLLSASDLEDSFLSESSLTLGLSLLGMELSQSLSGKPIGPYQIIRPLGRGGMGEVYLAEDPRLGRLVALKLLPPFLTQDAESILRFHQEARAASGVSHPNIAHVYEIGEAEGHHYIAMEYVEGSSLRVLLKRKSLEESEAVEIALQITQALIAAHAAGITHRDIKPENVMVRDDGYVKVLDFGLAKLSEVKNKRPHQWKSLSSIETTPGLIIGTTAYMSPEQVRGQETDARTDLWSLGVVLYELIARRRPFTGETASDVAAAILLSEPQSLCNDNSAASLDLIQITQKALSKEPGNRYQTAQDFTHDLQRIKRRLQVEEHISSGIEAHSLLESGIGSTSQVKEKTHLPNVVQDSDRRNSWYKIGYSHWRVKTLIAVIAAFPLLYVTAIYFGRTNAPGGSLSQASTSVSSRRVTSIVILPFISEPSDATLDYLSAGLTEDITRNLSRSRSLLVTAQYSARRARETGMNSSQIKQALGVETSLHGTVRRRGQELIIRLRLVELNTDATLWEDSFTASQDDPLYLLNSLTAVLITQLQGLAGEDKTLPRASELTDNNQAYRAYLEGRYLIEQRGEDNLRRAVILLERAVALDSGFSLAYVSLANAYNLLNTFHGETQNDYRLRARQAIFHAKDSGKNLAEVHTSLAKINMDYERNWAGAESEFRRAIELNPGYVLAHHWYGEVYLATMGRLEESLSELQTAHRLDPLSTGVITGIARTYIGFRQYDNAIEACRIAEEINPEDGDVYSYRASALMKLGRFDEAISDARTAQEHKKDGSTLASLGAIYASAGNRDEALRTLSEIEGFSDTSGYDRAIIYAALGDVDTAFKLLSEEAANPNSVKLLSIRIDPMLDTLRSDPRFAILEAGLGFEK
jgi:serine/threonine-protein kinase